MYAVVVNRSTRTWTHMYMFMLPIANKHVLGNTSYIESFQKTHPVGGWEWLPWNGVSIANQSPGYIVQFAGG